MVQKLDSCSKCTQVNIVQLILMFGLTVQGINEMVLVSMLCDLQTSITISKKQFVLMKPFSVHRGRKNKPNYAHDI